MTGIEWCKVIISISLSIKPKESAVGTLTSLLEEYRFAVDFLGYDGADYGQITIS